MVLGVDCGTLAVKPTKLSDHFTLAEFVHSEIADRFDIDNTPTDTVVGYLAILCDEVLEPVRAFVKVPVIILSGFRCPDVNRRAGSKPSSQHVLGQACDFRVVGMDSLDVCRLVAGLDVPFDQLIAEYITPTGGGWVHVSVAPVERMPRGETLTIDRTGTRTGLSYAR
jgi:zinc D-Ala-D-Ala carboxypeptidase